VRGRPPGSTKAAATANKLFEQQARAVRDAANPAVRRSERNKAVIPN
jgi:hypothetical protein